MEGWLLGVLPNKVRLLTRLSNAQEKISNDPRLRSPATARDLCDKLPSNAATASQTMEGATEEAWVTWAPKSADNVARLIQGYRQYLKNAADPAKFSLHVLIAMEPLTGLADPNLLLDLWRRPLLDNRYGDSISSIKMLNQPTQVVATQRTGPSLARKSIVSVALGISEGLPEPTLVEWRSCFTIDGTACFIQVDVPRRETSRTRRELNMAGLPVNVEWEGPMPSQGSNGELDRVLFRGFLKPTSSMTLDLFIIRIRDKLSTKEAVIASSATLGSNTALLAELTNTSAIRHLSERLQSGVLISAKTLLMEPMHDVAFWSQLVDTLARAGAGNCVKSISWRRSNGGRPWVRPQLLVEDLRNKPILAKNRSAGEPGPDHDAVHTLLINIAGETLGGAAEDVQKATVSKLAEILDKNLRRGEAQKALKEYEWMPVIKAGAETWADQVRLRVGHIEEATQLHSQLHGTPVLTGVSWCRFTINNLLLPVWTLSAQPGGDAGRALGRPARRG